MTLAFTSLVFFNPYPPNNSPALHDFTLLLILLPNPTVGLPGHPETGVELLIDYCLKPMDQSDLLGAVLTILHKVKLDDSSWLVCIDANGWTEGSFDFHVFSIVPHMVAGASPAHTP